MPIPLNDIADYLNIVGIDDHEMRAEWVYYLDRLDREWLKIYKETPKTPKDGETINADASSGGRREKSQSRIR